MSEVQRYTQLTARTWYGLIGAPVAWAVQLIVGWLLTTFRCVRATRAAVDAAHGITRGTLIGIDIAALLVSIGALWVGLTMWRASRIPSITRVHGSELPEFLAAASFIVSLIFTIAVLWQTLPALVLPVCVTER